MDHLSRQPINSNQFHLSTRLLCSNQEDFAVLATDIYHKGVLFYLIFLMPIFSLTFQNHLSFAQNESLSVSIVPGSASPFNGQFYV